ncbi:histidinol-phosphate aminotransferase [Caldimicrobium thiodismutans]|uniref:Histidinol-phosphate aminotransferase n=1 Tax=Caldimicrobium thiodismutans TaxID=1653476 RepID=A0A0U5BVD9_9BACT|nr:histidinol-phosphate transaminase [Caldimicrobium thiodismutans]BAU22565.1 histidinol-phosphate aminotransferase [Caldimicrobium thiodismutans]
MNPKPWLKDLKPYPPGKTLEEIQRELGLEGPIYKLNSNENPLGPSPKVISALKEALTEIHLYPEASYKTLRSALAKRWNLSPENIILGNGSNEILEFVFKAYLERDDEIIISEPSFLMYEKFGEIYSVKIKKIPLTPDFKHNLKGILSSITSKTKAIFLDHPHNPTGSTLKRREWEEFLGELPQDILVVLDEAYGEFIEDEEVPMGVEFLKKGYPVLITRTFSKAFGLAGLRLGYGMADSSIIDILNRVRQPFNVNLLAVKAGLAVLQDEDYQKRSVELVFRGRKYLSSELSKLGFKVYPSQANFIMVDFDKWCESLYEFLLKRGIFVRPLKAYGFINCVRITIGKEEANKVLIDKIKEFLINFK